MPNYEITGENDIFIALDKIKIINTKVKDGDLSIIYNKYDLIMISI